VNFVSAARSGTTAEVPSCCDVLCLK
jgi:hypothetical protein